MKIAFVYPATEFDHAFHKYALPSGLLSLAAVIETTGLGTVDIFDSRHMSGIPDKEELKSYDVIGFTAMSMQVSYALALAGQLRSDGYDGPIIFGGPHASVAPDHLREQNVVDAIFIGEAEESVPQYLHYLSGKPHKLKRLWLRDADRQWVFYAGDSFIQDLDLLPFPDRSRYADAIRQSLSVNITTTRGCPYKCNYCQPSKEILFGKHIRRRSVDNIIAEIKESVQLYCIESFSIDDDTFTFDNKVVVEFCEKVKELKLTWSCQTRTDVNTSTLKLMKDAGCASMYVGVESGSQRMLDLMGKGNSVDNNELFLHACKENAINVWCNMMVGYPGETIDDMSKSLAFLKRTLPERVCVSQVTPFPGTKLWNDNTNDIVERDWDDMARHVRKCKFRSMERLQAAIEFYVVVASKEFNGKMIGKYLPFDKFIAGLFWSYPGFFGYLLSKACEVKALLFKVFKK